ncbi:hypothetical protein Ping_2415 [Psychromonas ingrahamii 37]|uniref:Uncharacterized protein n=2 Tax=Psychromonas ingrahamii TaxID=357794 RepID=A1SXD2_PSYIN|nr:hypothetical protein Ping_2415 [Psychromonas ingrahamii 37]
MRSAHQLPLFTMHRMHPINNTKRINKVIIFTIEVHPDGFAGVNFFEASDYKLNAFGISAMSVTYWGGKLQWNRRYVWVVRSLLTSAPYSTAIRRAQPAGCDHGSLYCKTVLYKKSGPDKSVMT